jgi:hypothetical protein
MLVAALLIAAALAAGWKWRNADPLLAIGFSVCVFQVLMPFQLYNEVMLIPAVLWALVKSSTQTGQPQRLLRFALWALLSAGWLSTSAICMAHLINAPSIARIWSLPIVITWIFPIALLAYVASCAGVTVPANIAKVPFPGPDRSIRIPTLPLFPHGGVR